MKRRIVAAVSFLLLFGLACFADDYNRRTVITLEEPVIVSGVPQVTLAPGKYVIRLANPGQNRHIVQIFNEREDHLFTTVLAISNFQLERKGTSVLQFYETPVGNPRALRAWFYPGDRYGQEFIYPKGLAATIAREVHEPVLSTQAETVAELETAPITTVEETGVEEAFVAQPEPVREPIIAQAAPAPEPLRETFVAEAEPEPEPIAETLPATASPFFMIGLAGLASAAAGLGLRLAFARKS